MTPPRLEQQLQAGLAQYTAHLPADRRQVASRVSGIEGTPLGRSVAVVLPWLLGAAVLLTLLIACANVAILVIAQWTAREHEIAIRASLGASRGRVVRALLTEAVLMAAMGGVLGVAAALALRGLIVYRAGPVVAFFDLSIDPVIFLQAAAVTMAAGVLSGIGPALFETRRLHGNPMRSIASSERVRQRWRHALVVLEIRTASGAARVCAQLLAPDGGHDDWCGPDVRALANRARIRRRREHLRPRLDGLRGTGGCRGGHRRHRDMGAVTPGDADQPGAVAARFVIRGRRVDGTGRTGTLQSST